MHRKRLVVLLACSLTAISACKGGNNASPGNNNQDTLPSVDDGSGQQTAPETTPEQPEHQITNLLQPPIRLELPDALDLEYAKISGNARHVLFNQTDPDAVGGSNPSHAKLYDRDLDQVTEATVARDGESINSSSTAIDISTNGQRVLFQSYATNLLGAESIGSQVFYTTTSQGLIYSSHVTLKETLQPGRLAEHVYRETVRR